jgi:hypothetical protein
LEIGTAHRYLSSLFDRTIEVLSTTHTTFERVFETRSATHIHRSSSAPMHLKLPSARTGPKSPAKTTVKAPTKAAAEKTHIEVCARIRPVVILTEREGYFDSKKLSRPTPKNGSRIPGRQGPPSPSTDKGGIAWDVSADGDTAAQSENTDLIQGRTHAYTLDKVYGVDQPTNDVYDQSIHPLVQAAMEGYHSSVLAYGQTSTGKTFTMTGTQQHPGLIPLCIKDCFRYLKETGESRVFLIRLSYLEVYKEHIRDLLSPTPQPIRLFEGTDGLIIKGLKEEIVTSPEHVFQILRQGEARRQVGATHMNQHSSRSHVMVRLWIESTSVQKEKKSLLSRRSVPSKGGSTSRVSSLSLVDLAGSESVKLNGGERREEGHYINQSLMTLGQVVLSLSEDKKGHIPYRDSKLTRLLQPSLSGNARIVILCCISPLSTHLEESHNTFKFATRAKKIKQKAVINITADETTLLQNYRDEIDDLRSQLEDAKSQQQSLQEASRINSSMSEDAEESREEVHELVEAIKTMERLILKSRPLNPSMSVSTSSMSTPATDEPKVDDSEVDLLSDDDEEADLRVDVEVSTPPRTPEKGADDLHIELSRIRGLLGSVLQKRGLATPGPSTALDLGFDYSSPQPRMGMIGQRVETLQKQLEQQELTTSLRKADSSFLQNQLREKDKLLEEVSKVLEAVEKRQAELESENVALRTEIKALKSRFTII